MAPIPISSQQTHQPTAGTAAVAVAAAGFVAGTAPTSGTDGFLAGPYTTVRTYLTYAGAVTSARLRLYTRNQATGVWYRGASTDDTVPLAPASGNESRDWQIGAGVEFIFVLEAILPGTAGNTVAVDVAGVS